MTDFTWFNNGNRRRMSLTSIEVTLLVIIVAASVGAGTYFLYPVINPPHPPASAPIPAEINITIASNFGLEPKQGSNVHALNTTYNCSEIIMSGVIVSKSVYTAIDNFFNANKTEFLGTNNITTETSLDDAWFEFGIFQFILQQGFSNIGSPSDTMQLQGKNFTFDFGDNIVIEPVIGIKTFNNSIPYSDAFTFNSTQIFITAIQTGKLNYTIWKHATFLKNGLESMIIKDWEFDVDYFNNGQIGTDTSLLDVIYNGVAMQLVKSSGLL